MESLERRGRADDDGAMSLQNDTDCMLRMQIFDGDDVRNAMQACRRNEHAKRTTNLGSVYEHI